MHRRGFDDGFSSDHRSDWTGAHDPFNGLHGGGAQGGRRKKDSDRWPDFTDGPARRNGSRGGFRWAYGSRVLGWLDAWFDPLDRLQAWLWTGVLGIFAKSLVLALGLGVTFGLLIPATTFAHLLGAPALTELALPGRMLLAGAVAPAAVCALLLAVPLALALLVALLRSVLFVVFVAAYFAVWAGAIGLVAVALAGG